MQLIEFSICFSRCCSTDLPLVDTIALPQARSDAALGHIQEGTAAPRSVEVLSNVPSARQIFYFPYMATKKFLQNDAVSA